MCERILLYLLGGFDSSDNVVSTFAEIVGKNKKVKWQKTSANFNASITIRAITNFWKQNEM